MEPGAEDSMALMRGSSIMRRDSVLTAV